MKTKTTITAEEGNIKIKELLASGKKFAVSRMGITEIQALYFHIKKMTISNHVNYHMYAGGLYKSTIKEFCDEYSKGVSSGDIQAKWGGGNIDFIQDEIFKNYCPDSLTADAKCVEPFYFDMPWSSALKGKRVLVISPFSQTIRYQYKRKNELWENKEVLPDFELLNYTSVQSIGGVGPHESWLESLSIMKKEISEIDFDVALLGCGPYGLPLLSHIKENIGKSAIYIGGGLQILFGIKGKRWDGIPDVSRFYNENWRRPFDIEIPERHNLVEGGCYW